MPHPVHTGNIIPEWCADIAEHFQSLEFSVPVEFWMLDWKNEIRISIPGGTTQDYETFGQELLSEFPYLQKTNLGWKIDLWPKSPLSGWGIVL